ncbi:hypothetical protein I5S84_28420 [Pseudomonas putida]|uniref:Uncharacterized protein n=2 Tax=Pseudomonas TaxID=286 RepID=A0ABD7BGK8_PSEPU|nr:MULTISPECIES: hypothetical protein [Pseudomonas]MBH3452738.1 hypothetical protein [Pseudomonas putida]QOC99522.1 hypothetical protein ID616_07415 [Pseudomonas putida]WAP65156.1 hypothetical protein OZ911_07055 [Pseudomonas putida]
MSTKQLKTFRALPFNVIPSVVHAGSGYSEEQIAALIMGDPRDEISYFKKIERG